MENQGRTEFQNCVIKLRENPQRRREKVYIGCGAGFGGDRPLAALKLLQRLKEINYLVLECLAERTLADRYQEMLAGGDGYDSRISDWMLVLLPLAVKRGTCIITNMGAMDPHGAQDKVLEIGNSLGLNITVAVAHEVAFRMSGSESLPEKSSVMEGGISTYLGAAPIVDSLEKYKPNVIITSRVADAALFLAPMLLDLSLPYAEVSFDGKVCVAKADGSGGILNFRTCAEQLLYEIGDPGAYVTPDVVIDVRDVSFQSLSSCKVLCTGAKTLAVAAPDKLLQLIPKDCGWKGWGEISYGGYGSVKRAKAAEFLVRSWMEEVFPGVNNNIISYTIGLDSLKAARNDDSILLGKAGEDIRLRMDGLFEQKEHAIQFVKEFTALYTNGPAGGGGISTGHKREIILEKQMVRRELVFWQSGAKNTQAMNKNNVESVPEENLKNTHFSHGSFSPLTQDCGHNISTDLSPEIDPCPAPVGQKIPLYNVAHSRAGDKGNDLNFSIIPHFPPDIMRLKKVITPHWVKQVVSSLLIPSSFPNSDAIDKRDRWVCEHVKVEIYEVKGIHSLNVVVRNILDGGVNCSRRIDRHGKTISDLILNQQIVLPP
ncbi:uncharacterized protein LOC131165917 isoform X3 [Malania oleifera]|uniref:uncharacterized protein LOC131165917 isoform X3 n=1 Tax=Malania oleifera TaxID=397392 RepID=UPI0025AE5D50|nr:uncharacterized protein LOC131165917 isoform X3 [Malania oleifera]